MLEFKYDFIHFHIIFFSFVFGGDGGVVVVVSAAVHECEHLGMCEQGK